MSSIAIAMRAPTPGMLAGSITSTGFKEIIACTAQRACMI
jgi:hypothetical protein